MSEPLVSIVTVPRERFSHAKASLESVLANTPPPYELVYVDGGSPDPLRRYVEAHAAERNFALIREDRYLSPNQARNLGIARARGRYVAFVDNDVEVVPGWLEALVRRAEETGAWVVAPLILVGDPKVPVVHIAGGRILLRNEGSPRFFERHRHADRPLEEVASELHAGPTGLAEFHCVLVRRDVFSRLGPLDEGLLSVHEHVDLCLSVLKAGGTIEFEPAARVTYVTTSPHEESDVPFYLLRWSEEWNVSSLRHFHRKWGIPETDSSFQVHLGWLTFHRSQILQRFPGSLRQILASEPP